MARPPATGPGRTRRRVAEFSVTDLLAIQALVHSYPRRLDSGDLVGVGALFAHATVHFEGRPDPVVNDPAEVTRMFADFVRLYDGIPRTRHMICNLIVEPDGPGRARATSSVFVLQDAPGVPLQPIITGDYADRFEKVDGQWRFSERAITNDLFGNLSAHGKYAIG
ncbi:MAG: nuclear transport factor 2 family protein [Sphingomonadales bacterium]|nr:nuclear transport factor 2 family protein [Sphingomonadales bacterium]